MIHQNSTSSVASYIGASGNVDFDYKITGGGIATDGGLNYRYEIHSKYWGAFRLTYFWCPNIVLARDISYFVALKKENAVVLKWVSDKKAPGTGYTIEYSVDGKNFSSIGESGTASTFGDETHHEFEYALKGVTSGKLYFRIKQVDPQGKTSYSVVRSVDINANSLASLIVYPNPVLRKVSMQFDRNMNGNYVVDITNMAGQVVYNSNIKLNNANNMQVEIGNPPPSGLYYLKVTDPKTNLSYTSKIVIRR